MADETTSITAQCLCKAHTFTTSTPTSSLPLKATTCHCDSCRHQTGGLYFCTTEWPNPGEDISSLQKYAFSENTNLFFCSTCSTVMFCADSEPSGSLEVVPGVLPNTPGLVKYTDHIYVGDTLDGGASVYLRKHRDGTAMKRWKERTDRSTRAAPEDAVEIPHDWPPPPSDGPSPAEDTRKAWPELTPLRCHCGGVDLTVRSAADMASWPKSELPWFVDPTSLKYLASIDVCNTCRLSFGPDLANWTFALLSHIGFAEDGPSNGSAAQFPQTVASLKDAVQAKDKDSRIGTLTFYQSSDDVERYFCSRCAAAVFYAVHDRADMLDVAPGLLHHPSGARAEGLLSWSYGAATWEEDAEGGWREDLVAGAKADSEQWRMERGYSKSWRRVIREEREAAEKAAAEAEAS